MNNRIIEYNGVKMVDKDGELYFVKEDGNLVKFLELENYKDYIMKAIDYYSEELKSLKYGEMNIFKAIIEKLKTNKKYRTNFLKWVLLAIGCPFLLLPFLKNSAMGPDASAFMIIVIETVILTIGANILTEEIRTEKDETKIYKKNLTVLEKRKQQLELELSKNNDLLLGKVPETTIKELRRFEDFDPYENLTSFEPKEDVNTLKMEL